MKIEHNFKVSKGLNYDIIMGIDLQIKFGLILNNRELTWTSMADITHPYYPELINETYTVEAIAAIGGLRDADEYQKDEITRIIDDLIPPPTDTLPAAKIKPHKIDVEGHGPIRQKYRKIPYNLQMAAHAEIDKLLKEDIITESKSPWCRCPVIVPKPDGRIRFCIDYRKVNEITKKDAYLVHDMDLILDNLRNAEFLSTIDLSQAYHQIPMDENNDYHTSTKKIDGRKIGQDELKRQSIGRTAGCWTCLEPGHKARECPNKKAKSICWKCDKTGHFWYECAREAEEDFCVTCGRVGTTTEACPTCQEIEIRRRRNEIRKINDTTRDVPHTPRETPRQDATSTTSQTYRRPALLPTPSHHQYPNRQHNITPYRHPEDPHYSQPPQYHH
ncbi:unnamed protein product [Trichogramma brassicae]|uniref:CCHC-type domain-containing protein n=1 Tax=Trichogramma brassicae TaxID=86971 RepID=A0A6H5HU54_9HYME|nr:unnamed protein product [Trichogramma brassicae]